MGGEGRCMYVMRKVIVWGGVEIGVGGVMVKCICQEYVMRGYLLELASVCGNKRHPIS